MELVDGMCTALLPNVEVIVLLLAQLRQLLTGRLLLRNVGVVIVHVLRVPLSCDAIG